jgi:hypothetical protein
MITDRQETSPTQLHQTNGNSEIERLSSLVQRLQSECDELKKALARSEAERILYLKAVYAYERGKIRLTDADVDFVELQKASAGPVEMME